MAKKGLGYNTTKIYHEPLLTAMAQVLVLKRHHSPEQPDRTSGVTCGGVARGLAGDL